MAIDRPALRAAPVWFQEGWAESLAVPPPGPWSTQGVSFALLRQDDPDRPLLDVLEGLPGEGLLDLRRHWVEAALQADPGPWPWLKVQGWTVADYLSRATPAAVYPGRLQRGREFDPPGPDGWSLLAAYPGETVDFVLLPRWSGRPAIDLEVRYGASGRPEGGLLLSGRGERRLRIRLGRNGGLRAYLEPKESVASLPLRGESFGAGRRLRLRLEPDRRAIRILGPDGADERIPLDPETFRGPFEVRVYVRDGILVVRPWQP
ncbi:MAG: hypothetical protein D6702_09465 [Planctomycetota bacterium]|nr:MAG: hypothetical protein D6702_09465 [Planctomycetota bacterium]